jgi:hypothetical protein
MKSALVVALRQQAARGRDQHRKHSECRPERHAAALRQAGELGPVHERDTGDAEQGTERRAGRNRLLEKEPRAERGEQRARRIADRHQPGGDMLLRVINEDVAHAVHRDAHQRERGVLRAREQQRQATPFAPGSDDQRREEESVAHAHFRRYRSELVGDREPSGAPDEDASGKYRNVAQASGSSSLSR